MMLGIDLRCLPTDGSAGGGIAHAARAISKELHELLNDCVVCYLPRGAAFGAALNIVTLKNAKRSSLLQGLKESPCDVLFVPSGAVTPRLPVPAIPWVHDCDIFDHPEWFPQSWLKRQMTTRIFLSGLRNAPHIFTVSAYTKTAVERLIPSSIGRITVTGEGGDAELASIEPPHLTEARAAVRLRVAGRLGRSIKERHSTVLILGTVEPRKNIPLICSVWPEVAKAVPGADLIIAGEDGWKERPTHIAMKKCGEQIASTGSRLMRMRGLSDNGRRDLLMAADLVLVPSFSEGFGLVALEAIQAGTPVLASNRGALSEVVGKGMWLLDPDHPNAWRDAIINLLTDVEESEHVKSAQASKRAVFSWKNAAAIIMGGVSR